MGCCSGRLQNDGNLEYSKTNKDKILEDISSKKDLKNYFAQGWRLHHQYESGKSFLSAVIEKGHLDVFKTEYFSVSEASLLERKNLVEKPNYEFIFANWAYVDQLAKNYETAGFIIKHEAIINSFVNHEKAYVEAEKRIPFTLLRDAFGINKNPIVEEKKTPLAKTEARDVSKENPQK